MGAYSHNYKQEQTIRAHVDESAWVAQLKSAKALHIVLLEIPMPTAGASPKQKAVFEHVQQAQGLFCDGGYTECVGECRKALEELSQGKSKPIEFVNSSPSPQVWIWGCKKILAEGIGESGTTALESR